MLEQLPPFTQIFLLWVPLFEQSEFLMHKLDWVLEIVNFQRNSDLI
jgi:hypothetical protein